MTKRLFCILTCVVLLFSGCAGRVPEPGTLESSLRPVEELETGGEPEEEAPSESLPEGEEPEATGEEEASSGEEEEPVPLTISLTIPEGYTLARIGMTLEDKGICTVEEFIQATQEGDFSEFPLIAAQEPNENRCFKLEGYLFPDTYEIYTSESPDSIIRRMLQHTETKIDSNLRARIGESGFTVDEIITLASIIEKESFGHEHMPGVSSVLHNRLDIGMQIQCDVTITYVEGAIKPFITGDINRYNDYYNTYKCRALPAGAICNPSLDAILAALAPADTDYLFFVTDQEKNYLYAETWEEHLDNVEKAGL